MNPERRDRQTDRRQALHDRRVVHWPRSFFERSESPQLDAEVLLGTVLGVDPLRARSCAATEPLAVDAAGAYAD